jgi:hypothetical protein
MAKGDDGQLPTSGGVHRVRGAGGHDGSPGSGEGRQEGWDM